MKSLADRKDISKPKDIHRIINAFFRLVRKDALLSPYFADKTKADWEAFLPVMYSFWENVLFYSGGYFGNPMQRHMDLNAMRSFSEAHYNQWMVLFAAAIDDRYAGERAELMKERARNIATVMQVKLAQ